MLAFKCVLYQGHDWSRVDEATISGILLQNSGWIVKNDNEEVQPLRLTGTFLISSQHFHISQEISYHLPLEKFEKKFIFLVSFLKRICRQIKTCSYH